MELLELREKLLEKLTFFKKRKVRFSLRMLVYAHTITFTILFVMFIQRATVSLNNCAILYFNEYGEMWSEFIWFHIFLIFLIIFVSLEIISYFIGDTIKNEK